MDSLRNLSPSPLRNLPTTRRKNPKPCVSPLSELRLHSDNRADPVRSEPARVLEAAARLASRTAVGFAAAAAVISMCGCDSPVLAESLTVAFPVSRAREVNKVQKTLVEAWGLIRETFIDPSFNHQVFVSPLSIHALKFVVAPLRS